MFKDWCIFFTITVIFGSLCFGCAHDPFYPSGALLTKELCGSAREPGNVHEFLVNLRFLLDNEILLRPDFYDDECVKRFFGGSRIEWRTDSATRKSREIAGQPFLFVQLDRFWNQGVGVVWRKENAAGKEASDGKIKAGGGTSFTESTGYTIDEVTRVFGSDMKVEKQYIPGDEINHDPWGRYKRPGNHRLGGKRVTYIFNKPESAAKLVFFVAHNGEIEYTHFRVEETK